MEVAIHLNVDVDVLSPRIVCIVGNKVRVHWAIASTIELLISKVCILKAHESLHMVSQLAHSLMHSYLLVGGIGAIGIVRVNRCGRECGLVEAEFEVSLECGNLGATGCDVIGVEFLVVIWIRFDGLWGRDRRGRRHRWVVTTFAHYE